MRGFLVAAIPAICCACGPSSGPAHDSRPEPVVVYAAYSDENYLPELFSGFTRETGIPVTVRHRDEEQNISDVIGNSGSPRADVLLARTVQGIWRAADEGALLPLRSAAVEKNIPEILRDPDGYWVAAGVELAVIASKAGDVVPVAGYGNLIDPKAVPFVIGESCQPRRHRAVDRGARRASGRTHDPKLDPKPGDPTARQ
jgi:iron(III) transport system substrate-binding protein